VYIVRLFSYDLNIGYRAKPIVFPKIITLLPAVYNHDKRKSFPAFE